MGRFTVELMQVVSEQNIVTKDGWVLGTLCELSMLCCCQLDAVKNTVLDYPRISLENLVQDQMRITEQAYIMTSPNHQTMTATAMKT